MNAAAILWTSILLGGLAQIFLKRGVGSGASARSPRWWLGLLRCGWIWAWAVAFGAATLLWLMALSQLHISYAFPLLSASYVFVAILSRVLLGERVSWKRWVALTVICLGVVLIAGN